MRRPREYILLALLAGAIGCAQGTIDDSEGDSGNGNGGEETSVTDDTGSADDVPVTPQEDSGVVEKDSGVVEPDVQAPPEDVPAPPEDTGSSGGEDAGTVMDAGTPGVDVVTPVDTGTAMDSGAARDTGTTVRDVATADAPRTDVGVSCAAPQVACGGRCVNTTTDPTNCGACGTACAGATPMCSAGRCAAAGCGAGASDCDGNAANGCETSHRSTATCAAATNLGTWCGDVGCGFLCPSTSSRVVATRTGRASAWFRGRTNECSSCPARLEVIFTLTVPAGVDYDLFVYSDCNGTSLGRSQLLSGQTDRVTLSRSGDFGSDNFNWWVEVRYFSGSSCSNWTLTVQTRSGSASSC